MFIAGACREIPDESYAEGKKKEMLPGTYW